MTDLPDIDLLTDEMNRVARSIDKSMEALLPPADGYEAQVDPTDPEVWWALVHLMDGVYEKGIRVSRAAFRPLAARLQRSPMLPKWSLVIQPQPE